MAKIKSPTPKLRLVHWTILLLALLVIPTAIYAMTTWNDPTSSQTVSGQSHGSQLPDQSRMVDDLQAKPANSQDLGNSSSAQLQPSGSTQNPQPQSADFPANPTPCPPPGVDIACTQY